MKRIETPEQLEVGSWYWYGRKVMRPAQCTKQIFGGRVLVGGEDSEFLFKCYKVYGPIPTPEELESE